MMETYHNKKKAPELEGTGAEGFGNSMLRAGPAESQHQEE
jgi:hypothetical protein